MSYITSVIDFILNIDTNLKLLMAQYGGWIYGILFAIIFVETGLVVMPFLPGDSLLFVAGSLAGVGSLNILVLLLILFSAAVIGDTVNYHIGKYFGHIIIKRKIFGRQIVKHEHIDKTKKFFDKYGKKTIILARFVPIVRTLAPFVAGIGDMSYRTFIIYNVVGAFLWVFSIVSAGYFFGQIDIIKNNFEKVIVAILLLSIMPILIEYIKHKYTDRKSKGN